MGKQLKAIVESGRRLVAWLEKWPEPEKWMRLGCSMNS